jgi:hypothetical protein
VPSIDRGSALDNAISESFVSTLKTELVSRARFPTRQAAKTAIFFRVPGDLLQSHEDTFLAGLL